ALAADAAGHRDELQVEILDAELVDLLADLGDLLLPTWRIDERLDVPWPGLGRPLPIRRLDALFHGLLQHSTDCFSAPGKRTMRGRMQFALGEPREAERLQQLTLLAHQLLRHELAHADHFIAVIG